MLPAGGQGWGAGQTASGTWVAMSSDLTSEEILNGYTTPFEEALDAVKSLSGGGRRAVESLGALYAMVLDTITASFRELAHGRFAWREFIDQSWFLASVSVLPAILIAIPFGLVIGSRSGGLAGQIGAASFVERSTPSARSERRRPSSPCLLLAGAGGSAICRSSRAHDPRRDLRDGGHGDQPARTGWWPPGCWPRSSWRCCSTASSRSRSSPAVLRRPDGLARLGRRAS